MSTYSINPGTPTEAFKLADINGVLNELPDNITKLINPHDLRDAVYTAWENISFKPTINGANIEYVGFDQSTFREKIFLGKKQLGNTDILNASLLNSDVDIFLYNTKSDTNLSSQNTKIGFLAGPSQSIFYYGSTLSIPWIEARYVTNTYGNVIDLDIKNNSYAQVGSSYSGGNVNIYSTKGTVLINGLSFPTVAQNSSVTNGYVLSYQSGYLQWAPNIVTITTISQSGTFSISASPLIINGYNAMFSSSVPVPTTVGGIIAGSTFSNIAVTEMIRMMLYPYIAPSVSLYSTTPVIEYTSTAITFTFSYTITKYIASTTILPLYTTPTFISDTYAQTYLNAAPTINRTYTGTGSYGPVSFVSPLTFTLSVNDHIGTYSAAVTLTPTYPIFYGASNTATNSVAGVNTVLSTLNKIVSTNPNQTVPMSGNNVCIYYLVPSIYNISGSMSSLYTGSSASFDVKNVFNTNGVPFVLNLSYTGHWVNVPYNCYIYSPSGIPATTTIGSLPLYTGNYQFNF